MIADGGRKRISAADRAPQPATQPAFEDATIGGDAEPISWQFEERDVSFQKIARFLVVDQPAHDDLQDDGQSPPWRVGHRVRLRVCGAKPSYLIREVLGSNLRSK